MRLTSAARYNARALKQHAGISSPPSERDSLTQQLRGLLLPITTPFAGDGDLDLPGFKSNIRQWNQTGIAGYVVLGSTGERVNLDECEYLEVVEAARQEVETSKDRLAFIVGAGQQSTRGTLNEIKRVAQAVPVDAVLVITPHFYRPSITQKTLVEHYQKVADDSPAPLILYSMPALTGIKIEPETAALLSEHENVIGIKDSSADLEGLKETIKLVRKDFAVLTGNGTVLYEALSAGAWGAILAVGCVAPELCIEIFRTVNSGETERAATLQSKLTPLASAVTTRFGIGGLKAALNMKGYVGGAVRAPLPAPDDEARTEIRRCLQEAEYEPPRRQERQENQSQTTRA
ncbi:MAG: dihydrodipicolinate synthase family protein [Acidobacteriota bacterium]|nr:dihydrodipicolinate synthase family protein [Acidobacteriota bacterium]